MAVTGANVLSMRRMRCKKEMGSVRPCVRVMYGSPGRKGQRWNHGRTTYQNESWSLCHFWYACAQPTGQGQNELLSLFVPRDRMCVMYDVTNLIQLLVQRLVRETFYS
jgi:hypothetical protein